MKNIFTLLFFAVLLLGGFEIIAQPGNPTAPAPFGAIELLVAAGAALGGRYYYKSRQKQE